MDGQILKRYIENNKKPKVHVAEDLGMSKQNLYQLFDSEKFEPETISNIEKVFKVKWGAIKASLNIDGNIDTKKKQAPDGAEKGLRSKDDRIFEELSNIRKSNDKLIDQQGTLIETNKKLADKIISIGSNADQETSRGVILETLVDVLVKVGVDAGSWKDYRAGLSEVNKMLSGKLLANDKGDIRVSEGK